MERISMQPTLIVIGGPTGIGKTRVAVELASYYNTVIVSADSRQIFKEMSIGTAVPASDELKAVSHYFVQSRSIQESYNASIFEKEVMHFLNRQFTKTPLIIMVGGSGLYIDSVCNGIDDLPNIDSTVREKWLQIFNEKGIAALQEKVKEIDPIYFSQVDISNPKRLQKAIEVFEMTGMPYSNFLTKAKKERPFRIIRIALNTNREELYRRINNRVDKMIEAGLLAEVKQLLEYRNLLPLKTVGYSELFDFLDGRLTMEEALTKIKDHSRAYARRQITWFRRNNDYTWFEPSDMESMKKFIDEKFQKY